MAKLDYTAFLHDSDKMALKELQRVSIFSKVCSKFIAIFNESQLRVRDMSSKVRLSEQQLPRIYNMLLDICQKLSIDVPDLYLELDVSPNAYTYGDKSPSITITSGLLSSMKDEEIYAVIAHECGHIVCRHVLYHTLGQIILNGGSMGIEVIWGNGLLTTALTTPLKLAFYYWMRCSEFSADRAAAVCCGSAEPVIETMMRLAGGTTDVSDEINRELFIAQADDYKELVNNSAYNKLIEFMFTCEQNHPLLAVRASEAKKWAESERFEAIMRGDFTVEEPEVKLVDDAVNFCRKCGKQVNANDAFCTGCGAKLNV